MNDSTSTSRLPSKPNRLYYLDWLRVLGVIGVFLYHNALPYTPEQWRIVNATSSTNLYLMTLLFQPIGMPLLFLLAGAATWFALKRRTPKQYLVDRFKRLVMPFIIGSIILVPPQRYFTSIHHGLFRGSFLEFLGDYFSITDLWMNADLLLEFGANLWFVIFLFIFSLLTLPLFMYLRSERGLWVLDKLIGLFDHRLMIYMLVLPTLIIQLLVLPFSNSYLGAAAFLNWLCFFVYGYILFSDSRWINIIDREAKFALSATLLLLIAISVAKWVKVTILSGSVVAPSELTQALGAFRDGFGAWRSSEFGAFCIELIRSLFVLSSILTLLYAGKKFLNFRNRFLDYANEAVLPFYSIHQAIIVVVAFYVIQWPDSILVKYVTIGVSSFIITILLFEVFIRRLNPARALFGMRQRTQPAKLPHAPFLDSQPAERSNSA
jgi:glucans biosynthesis protein C